jgi:hypothetical protein
MTDDKTASAGPTVGFDQRRRYPAPTIDLTATVVADTHSDAPPESEAPGSAFATDQSEEHAHSHEASNIDGRPAIEHGGNDGPRNGSRNGPRWRGWTFPHWRLIGAGAAGGAIMLLIVLALRLLGFPPREQSLTPMTDRLSRIETQLENLSERAGTGGDSALADRLAVVESTVKALETDNENLKGRVSEAADAARSARVRAETAAKAAAQASDNPQGLIGQSDLDALSSRLATLENTTKAIQTELEKSTNGAGDQAARVALLATSVRLAVERGNGFAAEFDDLKSVIKDPQELAPLEPFAASGVPTPAVLQRDLSALTPALLKAANVSTSEGGFLSRLQANAEHLVRVRPLDETPGDEPENVVMRIELKSARGDIPGALAEFAKLPAAARAPAEEWIKKAESREAAIAQARKISTEALGALATGR